MPRRTLKTPDWHKIMHRFTRHEARLFLAAIIDCFIPTAPRRICFVTRHNVPLNGNLRIVLDAIAATGAYEVGFYKEGIVKPETVEWLEQHRVRVMQRFSWSNLFFILSSSTIILSHSARDAYIPHRKRGRTVINLWHGVALKRIEGLMRNDGWQLAACHRRTQIRRNSRIYDAAIASNSIDRLVNALAFQLPLEKVHATGLPRFDYLRGDIAWPRDLAADRRHLDDMIGGAKLVLYAPTFRDKNTGFDRLLSPDAVAKTKDFCLANGAVLGIRPHPYRSHEVAAICDGRALINLSTEPFPEPAVLLEKAEVLIVDYSSIWVDYLLRHRPIIFYVPDLVDYASKDRGFIHDYRRLFPGPLLQDWDIVLASLPELLTGGLSALAAAKHESASRTLLPEDLDERSSTNECLALIRRIRKEAEIVSLKATPLSTQPSV
jgi:CDP-glycerol glycerophosphotransferase (TagB/SpsB family)